MGTGTRHIDRYKTEIFLIASTGSTITPWVDMALYSHVTFFVAANNSSAGTPAVTVTAYQALDVTGSGSAVLSINNYFFCSGNFTASSSSGDVWAQSSSGITGGSFATASARTTVLGYAIEIQDTDLNLNSNFKAVALSFGAAASTTVTVWAHCFPRFDGSFVAMPSALT